MLKVRWRYRPRPRRGSVRLGQEEGTCGGVALAAPCGSDDGLDEHYAVWDLDEIWEGPDLFNALDVHEMPSGCWVGYMVKGVGGLLSKNVFKISKRLQPYAGARANKESMVRNFRIWRIFLNANFIMQTTVY